MNKRLLSVLAFALVVSALGSLLLYRLIATKLTVGAKSSSSQLVVASHDLQIGTLIKDSDIKMVDWSGTAPKGSIANAADVVGRGVVVTINEGEPVSETRLAAKGAGAGMAATIPPGMRAVAVRVNDVVGVAGFVLPGMRVDLLIAGTPPGGAPGNVGTMERTLLQNIEVLSAGQNIQKDAEGKPVSVPVVNLLVTPEQAETLSLASSETRIQLVLRNPMDKDTVKTPGTAVADLFSGQARKAPPVSVVAQHPRPKPHVEEPKPVATLAPVVLEAPKPPVSDIVEVITGSHKAEVKVAPTKRHDNPPVPAPAPTGDDLFVEDDGQ